MVCWQCGKDNKDTAKTCKQCGVDLTLPPLWRPTLAWHARTLSIIYVVLIMVYVAGIAWLKRLPEPYNQREIPQDMTPWLNNGRDKGIKGLGD